MVTRSIGYAYPWDFVGDPATAPRAAEMGLDSVLSLTGGGALTSPDRSRPALS